MAKGSKLDFSDFLNACHQAMLHIKGLNILNDCEENQKLTQKVPDWLAARWNRHVSMALMEGKDFPPFEDFARFVSVEAEIACNPVTSLHALHSSSSSHVKGNTNELKGGKLSVFSTQTDAASQNLRPNNERNKLPCIWCKVDTHQLSKCTNFMSCIQKLQEKMSLVERLSEFSSWSRATRAVARLLRRAKGVLSDALSTVVEREDAERIIIRDLQRQTYGEEIKLLSKGHQLQRRNKLYRLDVFLDTDGLIKVGGRLSRSSLCDSFKHPIVIPKEHHVTKLIITDNHEKAKHQGKGFTISEIRANGYWIPGMSRAV